MFVSSALATDFPLPYIGSLFYHDIDHWNFMLNKSLSSLLYIFYTNDNFPPKTLLNIFTPKHVIVVFIIHLLEKLQIFKLSRFGILELQ